MEVHVAGDPVLQTHDRLGELGLAVALNPGDGENLALVHLEADVVDDQLVALVDDRQVLHHERCRPRMRRTLVDHQVDRAAHHQRRELLVGRRRRGFTDDLAQADDRDAVRDLAHLPQLVGDEHDGGSRLLELAHDDHELVGLLGGEHCGGLVEHEHLRVAR